MLSSKTKNLIKHYFYKLRTHKKNFLSELNFREKDRRKILEYLKKENIKNLDELNFVEIISKLWATKIWFNKESRIKTILEANGIIKLKEELYNLIYGNENIDIRYDRFSNEIKYFGSASITEILCISDPENYVIWNDKARKGLEKLGIENKLFKKYYIKGKEYVDIINIFKEILNELKYLKYPFKNMFEVDYFLYLISLYKGEKDEENIDFDHDEIRDKIAEIGNFLGFETLVEHTVAKGAKVDVIWQAKIANLGLVRYVFEVHKKGSIDSLILNLQKALNNPTVQKLITSTNTAQIESIRKEINNLPENFRKSLTFWNVKDVIETYESLYKAMENINKLSLIKTQFEYETES